MKSTSSSSSSKGFTLTELVISVGLFTIFAITLFKTPSCSYAELNKGEQAKAKSNLSELNKMFRSFKMDNGEYPSDKTAKILSERHPDWHLGEIKGNHSNAYFRQCFYEPSVNSEAAFFAKISVDGKKTVDGDGELADGETLKLGENGMSYVMLKDEDDANIKLSITDNKTPLIMTSVYPSASPYAGDKLVVDNSSFEGNFFVLFADGSVKNVRERLIKEDDDESKTSFDPSKPSLFPKTPQGESSAAQYLILTPEL